MRTEGCSLSPQDVDDLGGQVAAHKVVVHNVHQVPGGPDVPAEGMKERMPMFDEDMMKSILRVRSTGNNLQIHRTWTGLNLILLPATTYYLVSRLSCRL